MSSEHPSSWKDANAAGAKYYFTGRPCIRGHMDVRYASTGVCKTCGRESAKRLNGAAPEKSLARGRAWRAKNRDAHNQRRREKRAASRERERRLAKEWREKNPEKVRATRRKSYAKNRLDPSFRLNCAIRAGVNVSLTRGAKGGQKWENLVGYSLSALKRHLEKQFLDGMSWENYGSGGWEVDHIVPLSAFNFASPDDVDFRRAWALSNLRPLWRSDNRSKNNQLEQPFQPSLSFHSTASIGVAA